MASASGSEFLLDLAEVEGASGLTRWKLLHRQQELRCQSLNGHEDERTVEPPVVIGIRVVLGFLEWIATQIEKQRDTQFDKRLAPYAERYATVYLEGDLPIAIACGNNLAVVVHVPKLVTRRLIGLAAKIIE